MTKTQYHTIVAGTDGSDLSAPTIKRAAWLAAREDADLVIVCAYTELSARAEAKNVATMGGDARGGKVLGRDTASAALASAVMAASDEGATIAAALLVDGEPDAALLQIAEDRGAQLIVLGAIHDRTLVDRLLGTVAEEVTKRAQCDVLIVRPPSATGAAVTAEELVAAETEASGPEDVEETV
ncbi:MAG: universal stress protein [Dermatophilaceae bacterium]